MSLHTASTYPVHATGFPEKETGAPAISPARVQPSSPYYSRFSEHYKTQSEKEGSDNSNQKNSPKQSQDQAQPEQQQPEIFKLISPAFNKEFLLLLSNPDEFRLNQIVKAARQARGVSSALPVPLQKREETCSIQYEQNTYLGTISFFNSLTAHTYEGQL